jgi:hypothetical protein
MKHRWKIYLRQSEKAADVLSVFHLCPSMVKKFILTSHELLGFMSPALANDILNFTRV